MNKNESNIKFIKYDQHQKEWDLVLKVDERIRYGDSWLQEGTLDSWRHERMHSTVDVIIALDPEANWLTVGDGRFGTDAQYLLRVGAKNVHCSDISDTLLKIAHEKGLINSYSAENAEFLSFAEDSFDYVYCKESLHHFPRPYTALSEMFRVAKKGIFLVEPRDRVLDRKAFSSVLDLLRRIKGRDLSGHEFETVGNYVYSFSEREFEKFLLGIHYTNIAFKGLNDAYFAGAQFICLDSAKIGDKLKVFKFKASVFFQNILEKIRFRKSGILIALLFKAVPSTLMLDGLKSKNWKVKSLPKNPHLGVPPIQ